MSRPSSERNKDIVGTMKLLNEASYYSERCVSVTRKIFTSAFDEGDRRSHGSCYNNPV